MNTERGANAGLPASGVGAELRTWGRAIPASRNWRVREPFDWRLAPRPPCGRSGGFVLIIVLVVIMLASMVAASLLFVLSAEHTAAAAGERGEQSMATAMSGVYQGLRVAADWSSDSIEWQDNPAIFQDQLVCDDGLQRWYFSVYSLAEPGGIRYGLTDEASKLNLFNAMPAMLETLPNLTPALVQSLLGSLGRAAPVPEPVSSDEIDSTADSDNLAVAKSTASWSCLDEVLNVSEFNMALLYGSYEFRSGRLDPESTFAPISTSSEGLNAQVLGGLSQFLTVCSYDPNLDHEGQPRVNLNDPDADLAKVALPESAGAYIEAMHRNGQSLAHPVELLEARASFKDERGKEIDFSSGIGKAELPLLLDRCTATDQERLTGLVNLNTAPARVLAALPGLNEPLAESIVSARVGLSPEAKKTSAWLYQEGILNADAFRQAAPYLTTRSSQFHFFVAAYAIPAGNYRVLEVVVDGAVKPPVVLMLREVSRLGLPFVPGSAEQVAHNPPNPGVRL